MVRWLSEDEQATWSAFIRMRQRLDAAMAAGLARDGLSMPDYEILVALSAAPGDCLRARDLAAEICWDKSRLSKHLARMDSRGLVERSPAADDARGVVVRLTGHGRRALEQAAPNHVALVRRLFVDEMTDEEAKAVRSLSERVVAAAERATALD
ncbi:MarR family winged helix-turn-helix transcriptional regulator [Nocardia sp. CDC159]|uniref:MarR family winged helix-turn-helix transcriptional regulator n=1 Tax=Nocardia pulmonis TaxID=2951408 RepID=A0A9X2EHC7_9NOCA|nr:MULTISPECIES: MarR family winged helix-turn-helix transcriptional regulator [Nocardia]MCM6778258.1 MarR family winged helix-turn-helix transcriptional regulator [Nocardia pulmonis]MCM6791147.1 MarR family winged helix-turn-helix transcriptional regulator [Nocardia sp. CDC159]